MTDQLTIEFAKALEMFQALQLQMKKVQELQNKQTTYTELAKLAEINPRLADTKQEEKRLEHAALNEVNILVRDCRDTFQAIVGGTRLNDLGDFQGIIRAQACLSSLRTTRQFALMLEQ